MPCGSEGNRRSGVALAMRHRLKWIIRAPTGSRPSQGDEHPTYALLVEYGPFTYLPTYVAITGLQDFVSPNLAVENWPGLYSYHVQENGARSSRLTGLVERKSTPTRLIFAACLKSDVEFAILRTYYTPFPKKNIRLCGNSELHFDFFVAILVYACPANMISGDKMCRNPTNCLGCLRIFLSISVFYF